MKKLHIAMLTHSVNPRGGVVHAIYIAEALHDLGHEVTLIAAVEAGKTFFRPVRCKTVLIQLPELSSNLAENIRQRILAYIDYFAGAVDSYDIYHAQDAISGCALAELVECGIVKNFVRTVHHLDNFDDVLLTTWQSCAFKTANRVLCVSRDWQNKLLLEHNIVALQINNGVDTRRYTATSQEDDEVLRERLGLNREGPLFLAVGGVEARKNTLGIFTAFCEVLKQRPQAQLVIVGGASLLDHSEYQKRFADAVANSGIPMGYGQPLVMTGSLPDADMPKLFRLANALVFPSMLEGFGLVVLEAIVSHTPVVISQQKPFIDYLQTQDCVWTDPEDSHAIALAMLEAVDSFPKQRLPAIAQRLAAEFSWQQSALTHLNIYHSLLET